MTKTHPNLAFPPNSAVSPSRRVPSLTVPQVEAVIRAQLAGSMHQMGAAEFGGDARYHAGSRDVLLTLLAFITEQSPEALTLAVATLIEDRSGK